jgi:DNA-binding response OmpR family regulator
MPQVVQLIALTEQIRPVAYTLGQESCTIGREDTCHIVVPLRIVSRLHARVERVGSHYVLFDAGSANGVFVNGCRIDTPHPLNDNDLIGLGTATELLHFSDPNQTLVAGNLRYDEGAGLFFFKEQPLDLSALQFRLLRYLYRHSGVVCSRESCAEAMWDRSYDPLTDAHALEEAVRKLRSKLRRIDPEADLIKSRRGRGYELIS